MQAKRLGRRKHDANFKKKKKNGAVITDLSLTRTHSEAREPGEWTFVCLLDDQIRRGGDLVDKRLHSARRTRSTQESSHKYADFASTRLASITLLKYLHVVSLDATMSTRTGKTFITATSVHRRCGRTCLLLSHRTEWTTRDHGVHADGCGIEAELLSEIRQSQEARRGGVTQLSRNSCAVSCRQMLRERRQRGPVCLCTEKVARTVLQELISGRSQVIELPKISCRDSVEMVKNIPQERSSERMCESPDQLWQRKVEQNLDVWVGHDLAARDLAHTRTHTHTYTINSTNTNTNTDTNTHVHIRVQ